MVNVADNDGRGFAAAGARQQLQTDRAGASHNSRNKYVAAADTAAAAAAVAEGCSSRILTASSSQPTRLRSTASVRCTWSAGRTPSSVRHCSRGQLSQSSTYA